MPRTICCDPSKERTTTTPVDEDNSSIFSQGDQDRSIIEETPLDKEAHTAKQIISCKTPFLAVTLMISTREGINMPNYMVIRRVVPAVR